MITDVELKTLEENTISRDLLVQCGINTNTYLSPLMYIEDILELKLECTGAEWKHAVEMANDEDLCPEDASLPVIVDGILAFIYSDVLESVGLDLTTYFTYRFYPPSKEFQEKMDKFEALIKNVSNDSKLFLEFKNDNKFHVIDENKNTIGAAYEIPEAIQEARKKSHAPIDIEDSYAGFERVCVTQKPDGAMEDTESFIAALAEIGGMKVIKYFDDNLHFLGYGMELAEEDE